MRQSIPARRWRLPLVVGLLVLLPVLWAWPQGVGGWRAAGIVAGWLGFGFWVAALLLMVREARLAAWLGGLERMYDWHHKLGSLAYPLILAHPLLLAADLLDESAQAAWSLLLPIPLDWAIGFGWLGVLLLVPGMALALHSGLPYRRWRAWHALLALPVAFAGLHLYALGLRSLLWGAPALAALFLLWRYLRSDCGLGARPYLVSEVTQPLPGIVEISLQPLPSVPFASAHPGQFVLLAFGQAAGFVGCGEFHPFTLSAIEAGGRWRVAIKALGPCSAHLQDLRPGVPVRVQGPFGEFLAAAGGQPACWFAGGIGITPFLARLRAPEPMAAMHLYYFCRALDALPYGDELRALTQLHPEFSWQPCVALPKDDVADFLPSAAQLDGRACYLCGPPPWMASVRAVLLARGVPEARIHFERFEFR